MKESALNLTKLLAQRAQETFAGFKEAVEKDATKTIVVDGSVHLLTSYVVNYVNYLFVVSGHGSSYESTLKLLFHVDPHTKLKSVVTRIMQALQNNLDGQKQSICWGMIGFKYIEESYNNTQILQYKKVSWAKILQCLTVQSRGSGPIENSNISRASVKDRFKAFSSQLEELHQRLCQWTVPDSELHESLRLAVSDVLLPAFRSFLKCFGPMIESGQNPMKST